MIYKVEVTREDNNWLATVTNLEGAHTFARNLQTLDKYVRELIVLCEDLPDDGAKDAAISYNYVDVPELVVRAAQVGKTRASLEVEQTRLHAEELHAVQDLTEAGYSVRDIGGLLGVTPAWVSRIRKAS